MQVRGDPSNPEFQIVAALGVDEWDRWNADRDRQLESAGNNVYNRYVSPDEYGAESLEGNGRWVPTPDYGNVWTPNVAPGWAPYRDGRWAWDDYYGWSWVGYEPWGWAPYHYGRWFFNAGYGGWCWWPGPIHSRHYWAPAYVGFFGFGGSGFGVGFGYGNVGWVPLAPFEVFRPWWGRGYYGRNAFYGRTILNNANVYNTYRNARVMNGVTAVNSRDFSAGNFRNYTRVTSSDLRSAGMVQGRLGITPSGRSMHFSDRTVANVPRQSANQRFFTRNGPVSGDRASFGQQRSLGNAPGAASRGSYRPGNAGPAAGGGRGSAMTPSGGNGGSTWRRFGNPGMGSNGPAQRSIGPGAQGGRSREMQRGGAMQPNGASGGSWSRFGSPGADPSGRSQFSSPNRDAGGRLQVSPPMVRERNGPQSATPQYSRPGGGYNQPRYNAPQNNRPGGGGYSQPRYSAPQDNRQLSRPNGGGYSQPRYSAPPQYSRPGGGGFSAPRAQPQPRAASPSFGGGGHSNGGGGRSFGGGGGGRSSSGGGGARSSGGGGERSHGGRR